jgi:hypothetical protein
LCLPSPKRKPKKKLTNFPALHTQPDVLALPDEISSGSDFKIHVVTPIRCRFKIESPDSSQSVIDLHMPNQVSVTPIKPEIKAKKHDSPYFIDICTPEHKPEPMDSKSAPFATRPPIQVAPGIVHLGGLFHFWEEGQDAVYAHEEHLGHCWKIGQSKTDTCGNQKKVTL